MTILHRSTAGAAITGSVANTLSVTPGTSPTLAGSTLILGVSFRHSTTTVNTPTDTGGNTWVKIASASQDVSPQYQELWWCKNAAAVTSVTVTFSNTGGGAVTLTEVTGLGTSPTVDVTNTGNGSSTTPTVGTTSSTANANEFAVTFVSWLSGTGTLAPGGSWTNTTNAHCTVASNAISAGVASQVLSSTGTLSLSGTGITSSQWYAAIASFQPAASINGAAFLGYL